MRNHPLFVITLATIATGCMSLQNHPALDAVSVRNPANAQPYVEAYIEFPGPQDKWSGPMSFLLHVNARNPEHAEISTMPPLSRAPRNPAGPTTAARALASTVDSRQELNNLALALQEPEKPFQGCLWPVRVRLVREDGVLSERQGCRSSEGWAQVVSQVTDHFLALAMKEGQLK